MESISNGSLLGAQLIVSIIANLVVFMAIMALADGILAYCGGLIGQPDWSVEFALGSNLFEFCTYTTQDL